jgi:hypothetical protein
MHMNPNIIWRIFMIEVGFDFLNISILLTGILNFYLTCTWYSDSSNMTVQMQYKFLCLCVYANFQVSMSDCPSVLHSAEVLN